MEDKERPYREPRFAESWTQPLNVLVDKVIDCVTLPERATGDYNKYRNYLSLSGPSEIRTFEGISDIPDISYEPVDVQIWVAESVPSITLGKDQYHNYGNLMVLEKFHEDADGRKCDLLSATVSIPSRDYEEIRQRLLLIRSKEFSFEIVLNVAGLGLDWTRKGSLPIVGVNFLWQSPGIISRDEDNN